MKKEISVLLVLLLLAGSTMAQKKKKDAAKDSTATVAVDTAPAAVSAVPVSTKAANDSLKAAKNYDSLNAQLALYKNFYKYISNKFFPERYKNLEIEKAIPLADSLSAANNSKWAGMQSLSKSKIDSLQVLLKTA